MEVMEVMEVMEGKAWNRPSACVAAASDRAIGLISLGPHESQSFLSFAKPRR